MRMNAACALISSHPRRLRAVWSDATWLCMRGMGMRARCHGWWDLVDVLVERLRFRSYRWPRWLARAGRASGSSGGERRISVRQPAPALLTRRTVLAVASWAAHAGVPGVWSQKRRRKRATGGVCPAQARAGRPT